jgi:hypothetical protein
MYLLYVDESGDLGFERGSRHLILGGAAIFEGPWASFKDDLDALVAGYFTDPVKPPKELHFKDLRAGSGEFRCLDKTSRMDLIEKVCHLVMSLHESEIRLFSVIVDKVKWKEKNPTGSGQDLYNDTFEELCGRFDYFLRRRYAMDRPTKGMVIADLQNSDATKALRMKHDRVRSSGTRHTSIRHVIETVLFLSSHESPGLQIADLCAYAVKRLVDDGDDAMIRQITYAFDREPMTSSVNPGKWHGVKYIGSNQLIVTRLDGVFSV